MLFLLSIKSTQYKAVAITCLRTLDCGRMAERLQTDAPARLKALLAVEDEDLLESVSSTPGTSPRCRISLRVPCSTIHCPSVLSWVVVVVVVGGLDEVVL